MGSTVCAEVMSSLRVSNRNVQTQLLCVITAIATHCPYLSELPTGKHVPRELEW